MGVVLDSSVVIDLLRGRVADPSVLAPSREPVMISAITLQEILVGIRDGEEDVADAILESFVVVSHGVAEATLGARWCRELRARGVNLSLPDAAIAATAAVRGVPLVSADSAHLSLPELRVEPWRTDDSTPDPDRGK